MHDNAHIHEDDLELYHAGHLELERVAALESHLSHCPDCQQRLNQCIGVELEVKYKSGAVNRHW